MNNEGKGASQEKGGTQEKLRMMREIEERNDERVKKWSGEHEQGSNGS